MIVKTLFDKLNNDRRFASWAGFAVACLFLGVASGHKLIPFEAFILVIWWSVNLIVWPVDLTKLKRAEKKVEEVNNGDA